MHADRTWTQRQLPPGGPAIQAGQVRLQECVDPSCAAQRLRRLRVACRRRHRLHFLLHCVVICTGSAARLLWRRRQCCHGVVPQLPQPSRQDMQRLQCNRHQTGGRPIHSADVGPGPSCCCMTGVHANIPWHAHRAALGTAGSGRAAAPTATSSRKQASPDCCALRQTLPSIPDTSLPCSTISALCMLRLATMIQQSLLNAAPTLLCSRSCKAPVNSVERGC